MVQFLLFCKNEVFTPCEAFFLKCPAFCAAFCVALVHLTSGNPTHTLKVTSAAAMARLARLRPSLVDASADASALLAASVDDQEEDASGDVSGRSTLPVVFFFTSFFLAIRWRCCVSF